jgi:hypothetical protein
MITNTKNLGPLPSPSNVTLRPPPPRVDTSQAGTSIDTLSTDHISQLRAALAQTPALRSEVIERASALAKDPGYPSAEIIGKMGRLIAQSKDQSLLED